MKEPTEKKNPEEGEERDFPRVVIRPRKRKRIWPSADDFAEMEEAIALSEFNDPKTPMPLLMMPVGLETRLDLSKGKEKLLLRIMPEQLHVLKEDTDITQSEEEAATTFWEAFRKKDNSVQRAALDNLVALIGPKRLGHVIEATAPYRENEPVVTERANPSTPHLTALPTRWIAIGYTPKGFGFIKKSSFVNGVGKKGLEVSAIPLAGDKTQTVNGVQVTDGNRWLVEFKEALERGMAMEISLDSNVLSAGRITSLIVFGVAPGHDPLQTQAQVERLLASHERNEGVAFLPQGAPTNNSKNETTPWTYSSPDMDHLVARLNARLEGKDHTKTADHLSNYAALKSALGLSDMPPLARAAEAANSEREQSRAMNTVLFEAVAGTFIKELFPNNPDDLDEEFLANLRRHFIDHVTGGAPLPTLRIGEQPYGVLPIMPLPTHIYSLPNAKTVDEHILSAIVHVREGWLAGIDNVPMLDPNAVDTPNDRDDPASNVTSVLASQPHPARFVQRKILPGKNLAVDAYETLVTDMQRDNPDLYALFARYNYTFSKAETLKEQISVWGRVYLDAHNLTGKSKGWKKLAKRQVNEVLTALGAIEQLQRPLDRLDIKQFSGTIGDVMSPYLEANSSEAGVALDDIPLISEESIKSNLQNLSKAAGKGDVTPSDENVADLFTYLIVHSLPKLGKSDLEDVAKALDTLSELPPKDLDRLARETLGLGSHRLDAWYTSLASAELARTRSNKYYERGLYLGSYGFLSDLELKPRNRASNGFIHAPSLAHAATAAVVRSGWLAHGSRDAASAAAIDASSARVRLAQDVLARLRKGQSMGTVLGHRFERMLRDDDKKLSYAIRDIRLAVLERSNSEATADEPVDGSALLDLYRSGALRGVSPFTETAIEQTIKRLEKVFDAVHDVALFEATHAATQGQPEQATAVAEAINQGTQLPPEFRAQSSPTKGSSVDHRVILALNNQKSEGEDQKGWVPGLRDTLAPDLERWLWNVLPPAHDIGLSFNGKQLKVSDLAFSALDFVMLCNDNPQRLSTPFAQLVATYFEDENIVKQLQESAQLIDTNTPVEMQEAQLLALELRRLLDAANPLTPSHLIGRSDDSHRQELAARDVSAITTLTETLAEAIDNKDLSKLARFGLALENKPQAVLERAQRTAEAVQSLTEDSPAAEVAQRLFGRKALVLNSFALPKDQSDKNHVRFDTKLADPETLKRWLQSTGATRPVVSHLALATVLSDLIGGDIGQLMVGQNGKQGDTWIGVSKPEEQQGSGLSVVAMLASKTETMPTTISGLLIDHWSEHVPDDDQLTGVAFHFDAPSSKPPQSLLLTTMPLHVSQYRFWNVAQALLDTLQFSAIRMVQPEDLADFGAVVPTIYTRSGLEDLVEGLE